MNDLKQRLEAIRNDIKKLVFADENIVTELTADQVKISERSVGGSVELVQADSTLAPAPDGWYKVDDFEFEVKDGKISSIKGQDEPAETAIEEMEGEPAEDKTAVLEAEIADLKAKLDELMKELEAVKEASDKSQAEFKQFATQVIKLTETFSKMSTLPVEFAKPNPSVKDKSERQEKINTMLGLYSKK